MEKRDKKLEINLKRIRRQGKKSLTKERTKKKKVIQVCV